MDFKKKYQKGIKLDNMHAVVTGKQLHPEIYRDNTIQKKSIDTHTYLYE